MRVANNYERISFNFGPTLLSWMEQHAPDLYAAVLRADKRNMVGYFAIGTGLLFLIVAAVMSNRLGSYGSYGDFQDGNTFGVLEVKLGYVLMTLAIGVGVAAAFVALELARDSRRVRAR